MEKAWKNLAKTLPNPSPNLPKSIEKPSENAKKTQLRSILRKNSKEKRSWSDLRANLEPTWPPKAKKNLASTVLDGIRDALSEELRSTTKAWDALMPVVQHAGGSTRPPRIVYAPRVPPRRRRTSNVRLPLELRSDRRETSATRVSDDLQISIFRRRKFFFEFFFGFVFRFFIIFGRFSRS